jgi:4-hydroxy-3-polyprenylbenzoate decarboxylase
MCREGGQPLRWFQIPPDWNLGIGVACAFNASQGIVQRLSHYVFGISNLFDKLIIVDSDIYPTQLATAVGDMINKAHPLRDYRVIPEGFPPAVMPYYGELEPGKGTPRTYIDACFPAWWTPEERPSILGWENTFPKEIKDKVIKRWKELNIPVEPFVLPVLPGLGQQR